MASYTVARTMRQGNKEVLWLANVKELNSAAWNERSLLLTSQQTTEFCGELDPINKHTTEFQKKIEETFAHLSLQMRPQMAAWLKHQERT